MRVRRIDKTMALRAMRDAAHEAGVDPARLDQSAYRRFRAHDAAAGVPSDLTIALLFGGWEHACELAHEVARPPEDVEDAVRKALYGSGPARIDRVVSL